MRFTLFLSAAPILLLGVAYAQDEGAGDDVTSTLDVTTTLTRTILGVPTDTASSDVEEGVDPANDADDDDVADNDNIDDSYGDDSRVGEETGDTRDQVVEFTGEAGRINSQRIGVVMAGALVAAFGIY